MSDVQKRAYRIKEFCEAFGIGRTTVYTMMKAGKLRTVKIGGSRLIAADEAEALLKTDA